MSVEAAPSRARPHRRRGLTLESPLLSLPAVLVVLVGFVLPLCVLVVYSLWPTVDGVIVHQWTFSNYERFFEESTYWQSLLRSFGFVALASAITVVCTFPFAYFVATKVRPNRRMLWILLAVLPFWTSYLIRVFSWMNLLGDEGLINDVLMRIGLIGEPLALFGFGKSGIVITFVYLLFPLSFLTTYIAIERMNPAILEAASDVGARPWQSLLMMTLPIARTGLIAGFVFSFITMMGDYVTPQLIGGTEGTLYSSLVTNQFNSSLQWGFGSALALVLVIVVFALLLVMRRASGGAAVVGEYTRTFARKRSPFLRSYSLLFLAFLYLPIGLLVTFAFNDTDRVGLPFEGFTTRWFTSVFENTLLLESLWTSLTVGAIAVGISLVLGTVAAIQLARRRGRLTSLSTGIVALPLFLPPVLLGLAIIIGLNALGVDRGLWTIVLGHTVLTLPIVTLLVLIRLEGLDPNQELAAMDLGAKPRQALLLISVPQALPGILAAALIAFAVSIDEFILTFLVTGAETTLPLYVFGSLRFAISPELNAVSSLMLGASFLLVLAGVAIAAGRNRLRRRPADALPDFR